jgi:Tol biopolymer transport system component
MIHGQKIEVIDYGSDLVFFDVEKETLTNILKTDDVMETFPCWAPDGSKVYYCAAQTPYLKGLDTKAASDAILPRYDSIRYNLMSIPFDAQTKTFGTPEVEVDCNAMGKSAAVPKVSPDGRFVLFTMADYGQFHIWHHSADLYVKDLQSGEVRPLDKTNSFAADSYHSWSSNGRWLVVASRREDGSYSRPYIAYFDKEGKAHKAFLLPQKDPEFNLLRMKSYNVPEFSKNAITVSSETLKEVIYDDKKANTVKYSNKIK